MQAAAQGGKRGQGRRLKVVGNLPGVLKMMVTYIYIYLYLFLAI